jgi:hypothetical protein
MVVINDNTAFTNIPSSDTGDAKLLCVFYSPKGIDRVMRTVKGQAQFLKDYGIGAYSIYGQPLLNAYNAALSGAATLQCMRVTAANSVYSTIHLVAQYKLVTTGVSPNEVTVMHVRFLAKAGTGIDSLANLESSYTELADPTADGFTETKILSVAYLGRGSWGDNIRIRISSYGTGDKENVYKNYNFEVYENDNGLNLRETFPVVFGTEDAMVEDNVISADSVVNDPSSGSSYVMLKTYTAGFEEVVNAYNAEFTDSILTAENFDLFLGVNKLIKTAIENYEIDTTSEITGLVAVSDLAGIALTNGSDGDFSPSTSTNTRATAFETAYTNAFNGTTDPSIKSKSHFPVNLILDANYPVSVKILLAALGVARTDCVVALDCGTAITTKSSILTYISTNLDAFVLNRVQMIDAYAGKIRDPYSKKVITVTGTYFLAYAYPLNFQLNGGKHVPLAGNNFGILYGFIPNTVYPIFDEDIDSDVMDDLVDARINFARINANQDIIRATQTTRQPISSNLSEANNMFILLDIKRDCEKLCAKYDYNFSEAKDILRFNKDAANLLDIYASAQVRSIEASFNKSDWEAARGILHLYVGFVNKDLVKTTIIEIDVNR